MNALVVVRRPLKTLLNGCNMAIKFKKSKFLAATEFSRPRFFDIQCHSNNGAYIDAEVVVSFGDKPITLWLGDFDKSCHKDTAFLKELGNAVIAFAESFDRLAGEAKTARDREAATSKAKKAKAVKKSKA